MLHRFRVVAWITIEVLRVCLVCSSICLSFWVLQKLLLLRSSVQIRVVHFGILAGFVVRDAECVYGTFDTGLYFIILKFNFG